MPACLADTRCPTSSWPCGRRRSRWPRASSADARARADGGRRRAGELGAHRAGAAADRRRLRRGAGGGVGLPAGAAAVVGRRLGPAAHADAGRAAAATDGVRQQPRAPDGTDAPRRAVRRVHAAVQHERAAGDQPPPAPQRRGPPHRHPARRRLRPRGRPHPLAAQLESTGRFTTAIRGRSRSRVAGVCGRSVWVVCLCVVCVCVAGRAGRVCVYFDGWFRVAVCSSGAV